MTTSAPPETDWVAAVPRLARTSLLVVGDVMLDRFVYGRVERISPEAPVPVLSVGREVAFPGGAGNVVRNLTALGAMVSLVSIVGDDQAGSDLTGLIGGQPNVEPWLLVQGGRLTTVKTRYLAGGQQLLRADQDDAQPIHAKLAERMISIARNAIAATKVLVLSDYEKGILGGDVAPQLIAAAKRAGRMVVADPKGPNLARFEGADVVIPNLSELSGATGMRTNNEDAIVAAANRLMKVHKFGAVLVARGSDGMTLVRDGSATTLPAEARDVIDIAGAGDAVAATVAAGLAARLDLSVAVRLASIAAGVVVGKVGTAVVEAMDLLAALTPQGGALRKIVNRTGAVEQVERWRQRGMRIGLTNGCFDMMHAGHVHLLEQARAACDRLVVIVNSDGSFARQKISSAAAQPEAARAASLASLTSVDLVCIFHEDTPEALIRALRPEVLVKGANYTLDQVVGADLVQSWGGRVLLADLLPGHWATPSPSARMLG